jgi:lambda repressor-like predicted transcriptional regulator
MLVLIGAGAAFAHTQGKTKPAARTGLVKVAAEYVGLAPRELVAELRKGRSLAQVAAARGKSSQGLEQALLAAAERRLNGRDLSAERKAQIQARLPARIHRLVEKVWRPGALRTRIAKAGLLKAAAAYLGLSRQQLAAERRAGKSLAQVATAQGKSVDGLKDAMLDAVEARLDRVGERLSPERRTKLLSRAAARIERLLHRTRG